jgi:hypothetical protein
MENGSGKEERKKVWVHGLVWKREFAGAMNGI